MPTTRDLDAELDERLQRFAASGLSRAGMLAQLNLAGYPIAKLRERFPEMPDVAFGLAPPVAPPASTEVRAAQTSSPTTPPRARRESVPGGSLSAVLASRRPATTPREHPPPLALRSRIEGA